MNQIAKSYKHKLKALTVYFAIFWILINCLYVSSLIGTLAHELMHKSYSLDAKLLVVNYDGSGNFQGATFRHSHEWVYFNGYMVEVFLMVISLSSVLIIYEFALGRR